MPEKRQQKINDFQAKYIDLVLKKATAQAEALIVTPETLAFDPQGRILIEVILTEADYKELGVRDKNDLQEKLGRPISDKTTVSLDINKNKELLHIFHNKLKLDASITGALNALPKGSIIALQQEFHFHLNLHARTYLKLIPELKGKDAEIQIAHQSTMLEINKLVMKAFSEALKKAWKDPVIDLEVLNHELDKARKTNMPDAHKFLQEHILVETGINITEDLIKKSETEKKTKYTNVAEVTSATPNDVLHTNVDQGLAILTGGSDHTAHDRILGKKIAHRQLITVNLNNDGTFIKNRTNTNRGEESATTNQFSSNTSSMQSHKKDVAEMIKEVSKLPIHPEIMNKIQASKIAQDKKNSDSEKAEKQKKGLLGNRIKLREARATSREELLKKLEVKLLEESEPSKKIVIDNQIKALQIKEDSKEVDRREIIATSYNLKDSIQVKLSDTANKELYRNSPDVDNFTNRNVFDTFLKTTSYGPLIPDSSKKAKLKSVISSVESGKRSISDAKDAVVTMEKLLGPEGAKKYQAALLEERNSRLFKEAVLMQASQPMDIQTQPSVLKNAL